MSQILHEHTHHMENVSLNIVAQICVVLFIAALVFWTIFFTNYAPVHDFFHGLRHALYVIPCH